MKSFLYLFLSIFSVVFLSELISLLILSKFTARIIPNINNKMEGIKIPTLKVYVVVAWKQWCEEEIKGIFSKKEDAELCSKKYVYIKHEKLFDNRHYSVVREFELNKEQNEMENEELLKSDRNNAGDWNTGNGNSGNWNSGDKNAGNCNAGNGNSGNCNSGNCNGGNRNSGDWNVGHWNSGDENSGNWNVGHYNAGDWNVGNCNAGNGNVGNCNSGNCNAGARNSGDWNVGHWNSGNENSGYFNTQTPDEILVFNKICKRADWVNAYKPSFLFFELTHWVSEAEMTDEDKKADPDYHIRGGQLRTKDYKAAFKASYETSDPIDRAKIKALPNFDADIFFEISGIKVE